MPQGRNQFGFPVAGVPFADVLTTNADGLATVTHPGFITPMVNAVPVGERIGVHIVTTTPAQTVLKATTSPLVDIGNGVLVQGAPVPAAGTTIHVHVRDEGA